MYEFAHNKTKLNRALAICGSSPTEECVRAEYVKMGGLVLQTEEKEEAVDQKEITEEETKKIKKTK